MHRNVKITMYRLGLQSRHHYIRLFLAIILIIGLITVGVVVTKRTLQSNTILTQSTAIVRDLPANSTLTQHIATKYFSLDLPADWHAVPVTGPPYATNSWRGVGGDDADRSLDLYFDAVPPALAVNHLLPVQANGSQLDVIGNTSDNCVNFTDKSKTSAQTGTAPSKWGGVDFLCDMGNYERDVVGIGSPEGNNETTLVGPTTGQHHIFMTYTDNSANPDYTILVAIVKSLHVL